ncbi:MAG: CDP-alcohol phosphatidyltransferase family protein [Bacteroidetes bacterium]|nr:CDP-alcohol phosphatidyltransferase family protein [Bacteroidota bacterium]MDA0950195.1 CDP-alcohol phosphatidyltransferase family protein [Bacteroidota bacterium]
MRLKDHSANAITLLNAIFGFLGCIALTQSRFDLALAAIIFAAIADFLDGFVARMLKINSVYGNFLDSMADLVSFGVLPSLWWYFTLSSSLSQSLSIALSLFLFVGALLRLVRFSVYPSSTNHFEGLPSPAMALFVVLITRTDLFSDMSYFTTMWFKRAVVVLSVLFALWMVSKLPTVSMKFKGFGFKENSLRYLVILSALIGLFILREAFVLILLPAYAILSLLIKR